MNHKIHIWLIIIWLALLPIMIAYSPLLWILYSILLLFLLVIWIVINALMKACRKNYDTQLNEQGASSPSITSTSPVTAATVTTVTATVAAASFMATPATEVPPPYEVVISSPGIYINFPGYGNSVHPWAVPPAATHSSAHPWAGSPAATHLCITGSGKPRNKENYQHPDGPGHNCDSSPPSYNEAMKMFTINKGQIFMDCDN